MHRGLLRAFSRTSLPHPIFEPEHHLLKTDPTLQNMINNAERRRKNKEIIQEPIDYSYLEYNQEPVTMSEVSHEDYQEFGPTIDMFFKLHADKYPEVIINNIRQLPKFGDCSEIQQLEKFDRNLTHLQMSQAQEINTQYFISRFCPPRFKEMIDAVLEKIPICGEEVDMDQREEFEAVQEEINREVYIFHFGGGAFFTLEERCHYRMILLKQLISGEWLDDRKIPFVKESEDLFMLGVINWPQHDDKDFRFSWRPYFREFYFDKELFSKPLKNRLGLMIRFYWQNYYYTNPKNRGKMIGNFLVERIQAYVGCPEFRYSNLQLALQLPESFAAKNNIIFLHVWLITERLIQIQNEIMKDIENITIMQRLTNSELRQKRKSATRVLKFIVHLSYGMRDFYRTQTEKWVGRLKLHPVQRRKVMSLCEKVAENTSFALYKHFMREQKTEEGIESLMQLLFFPSRMQKRPYMSFTYQISEYVTKHREYLQTLTLEDIQGGQILWDVMLMDFEKVRQNINEESEVYKHEADLLTTLTGEDMQLLEELERMLSDDEQEIAQTSSELPPPEYPKFTKGSQDNKKPRQQNPFQFQQSLSRLLCKFAKLLFASMLQMGTIPSQGVRGVLGDIGYSRFLQQLMQNANSWYSTSRKLRRNTSAIPKNIAKSIKSSLTSESSTVITNKLIKIVDSVKTANTIFKWFSKAAQAAVYTKSPNYAIITAANQRVEQSCPIVRAQAQVKRTSIKNGAYKCFVGSLQYAGSITVDQRSGFGDYVIQPTRENSTQVKINNIAYDIIAKVVLITIY